ncbi:hypothetical protein CCACVL1_10027 [Corchorus capsularis]|uniref:BZIP domain-containing protein n=1 Tax=Corchorus capsularis TaxID=210143 RepID=A0A1R3IT36_COCAP|nr:hypothetical protein CCACVL1_10027 [Corchorus capsularis]
MEGDRGRTERDDVMTRELDMGRLAEDGHPDVILLTLLAPFKHHSYNTYGPKPKQNKQQMFLKIFRLSKKTVDEVWKEIVDHGNVNAAMNNQFVQHHHLTLGETTLEDFLVRASVINTGTNQNGVINPNQQYMTIDPMAVVSQQADWLQYQMSAVQQQQITMMDSNFSVPHHESVYENQVVDVGFPENQLAMTSMPLPSMSATSSDSQANTSARRRRYSDGMEKTIERRQKRMIKNRESAARSRARKQEVEVLLSSNTNPQPKYQLRRTSSASF